MIADNLIDLPDQIFVTGIGTGVGKTVVSAYLCKYYGFDYWKPIQAGELHNSDSQLIKKLSPDTFIWPERYKLNNPMSPHAAAEIDHISIKLEDFNLSTRNKLIVEGAGGLMVPINSKNLILDLIDFLRLPVVLVIRDYLGCINHSLLSIEVLRMRELVLSAVIFNGNFAPATLSYLKTTIREIPFIHLKEMDSII